MKIRYSKQVIKYLEELVDILIENEYFSFYDYAINYVDDILNEIESGINNKVKHKAPEYFKKYGDNMFYITYIRTKKTTWFIFFTIEGENQYLIKYITNNYKDGKYFIAN